MAAYFSLRRLAADGSVLYAVHLGMTEETVDYQGLIGRAKQDLHANEIDVLRHGKYRTPLLGWLDSLDKRRKGKTAAVYGETDAAGIGDDLEIQAQVDVHCEAAADADHISPDATLSVPSTIVPGLRTTSQTTGETHKRGRGRGKNLPYHTSAKHHVAERWPRTQDGNYT